MNTRKKLQKIGALRLTAARLQNGAEYDWSHQGNCNCGHLVQTVTKLSKAEIHRLALEKAGDWGEKAMEYCPISDYPIDHIITTLLELGFTQRDLHELERLSSLSVLAVVPEDCIPLRHNKRRDVVLYMKTWAGLLEEALLQSIPLPNLPAGCTEYENRLPSEHMKQIERPPNLITQD
ncbi:hypothetical protein MJD09_25045 [bacterium]|nr:hypothetical protein [bacterium]